jgi:tetratricopeptide (TPR) repeat protein
VKTDGWCAIETLPDGIYLFDNERAYRVEGAAEAIDALLAAPDDAARFPEVPRTTSPEERADPARNTVELAPKKASAWHGLGHVLQRMKRDGDATPCLERALAEYDAQLAALTGDDDDDPDERNDLRFWRAAVLSRLRRRDEVLAELRAVIPDGHRGNYFRRRITDEEDFEWLKSDEDFKALTAKVAKPKRAPKTAKKTAAKADDGDGDDGDDE